MQIKELSRATGVDVETIRYYEKQGLLPEPARRSNLVELEVADGTTVQQVIDPMSLPAKLVL